MWLCDFLLTLVIGKITHEKTLYDYKQHSCTFSKFLSLHGVLVQMPSWMREC